GILSKLPENINKPGDVLGKISKDIVDHTDLDPDTIVTTGIHDSNSSLLPYLINGEKNFILNSTGTWCVVMHPTTELSFTKEELGKMVFYNISANRDLVKTAIFMGGLEFETYTDILKKIHNRDDYPELDIKITKHVLQERSNFILPGVVKGAGQFPDSDPRIVENDKIFKLTEIQEGINIPIFFENYEKAYHILVLSLVLQTKVSIERVNAPLGSPIYIEGGFRHNRSYIKLIASIFPDNPVYITNIAEATSFGAALLGKGAYEKVDNMDLKNFVNIDSRRIKPVEIDGFNGYFQAFLNIL
ncbi:MAG: carbohydrate kinase, partial [Spirochaetales bacterium]|nr:carbohydrate kinase [Spirochaetales bacterium]